ncbi:MAG: M23 family metallopeptidase [Oscillospiraceae bacterium]|jgi:murein DD-endopeptidase MepM/ murein hydrolase activator NlpD|nr:M23 family metallopeptidase [Oscillospiraceae bacterium]
MDNTSARRHTSRRRRHSTAAPQSSVIRPNEARLAICAALFLLAVLMKLAFPTATHAMAQWLGFSVDYKAALAALGDGVSGERDFSDVMSDVWTIAFRGETPEVEVVVVPPTVEDGDNRVETGADSDANLPAFAENSPQTPAGDEVPTGIPTAPDELARAVIAAWNEGQREFEGYGVPAGVSYDMPALGVGFTAPADGTVSSGFGYRRLNGTVKFHYGTDVAAEEGAPVRAFSDGVVTAVGDSTTYGNYIIITSGAVDTRYAHCKTISAQAGQAVAMGEEIATVGATGNATSPCLHFELRIDGMYVNPEFYLTWA